MKKIAIGILSLTCLCVTYSLHSQVTEEDLSSKHQEELLEEDKVVAGFSPLGVTFTPFTNGLEPGYNITVVYNGGLRLFVSGLDENGDDIQSDPYDFIDIHTGEDSLGVELEWTPATGSGGILYGGFKLTEVGDNPYGNSNTYRVDQSVSGANTWMARLSGSSKLTGTNTPSFIGANDGRNSAVGRTDLQYIPLIKGISTTYKIRLHYTTEPGYPAIIISGDNVAPATASNVCKWDLGIFCWGKKYNQCICATDCPDPLLDDN